MILPVWLSFRSIWIVHIFCSFSYAGYQACIACETGSYKDTSGSGNCTICPAGSKCPDASSPPIECGAGEYRYGASMSVLFSFNFVDKTNMTFAWCVVTVETILEIFV